LGEDGEEEVAGVFGAEVLRADFDGERGDDLVDFDGVAGGGEM
jgi:hypothetical protein